MIEDISPEELNRRMESLLKEEPDEIIQPPFLKNIFLGNLNAGNAALAFLLTGNATQDFLKNYRPTAVLRSTKHPIELSQAKLATIPLNCFEQVLIGDSKTNSLNEHFAKAFNFIDIALHQEKQILIHCDAGASRSPSVLIAYLIARRSYSYQSALALVQQIRPCVEVSNFSEQLLRLEADVREYTSELARLSNYIKTTQHMSAELTAALIAIKEKVEMLRHEEIYTPIIKILHHINFFLEHNAHLETYKTQARMLFESAHTPWQELGATMMTLAATRAATRNSLSLVETKKEKEEKSSPLSSPYSTNISLAHLSTQQGLVSQGVHQAQQRLGQAVLALLAAINTQRQSDWDSRADANFTATILSVLLKGKDAFQEMYKNPTLSSIPAALSQFIQTYVQQHPELYSLATYPGFANVLKKELIKGNLDSLYQRFNISESEESVDKISSMPVFT